LTHLPGGTPAASPFAALLTSRKSIVSVCGKQYLKLGLIGRGGSSKVFKVLGPDLQCYALKRQKMRQLDDRLLNVVHNEISLLRRLAGRPSIVRLIDAEIVESRRTVYMVMEHGEIDLSNWLKRQRKPAPGERETSAAANASNSSSLAPAGAANAKTPRAGGIVESHAAPGAAALRALNLNVVRLLWQQMLTAVHVIHEERIVHGDLKPANFLFVRGTLKLIDFGIAKAIESNDTTNIVRDSQVGTLNFMAPEALADCSGPAGASGLKLSRASDIWSLGCILYQMVYGKPPFAALHLLQKMRCIVDPKHKIAYPPLPTPLRDAFLLDVMKSCLQRAPARRPLIDGPRGLLRHAFLHPHLAAEANQGAVGGRGTPRGATPGAASSRDGLGVTAQRLHGLLSRIAELPPAQLAGCRLPGVAGRIVSAARLATAAGGPATLSAGQLRRIVSEEVEKDATRTAELKATGVSGRHAGSAARAVETGKAAQPAARRSSRRSSSRRKGDGGGRPAGALPTADAPARPKARRGSIVHASKPSFMDELKHKRAALRPLAKSKSSRYMRPEAEANVDKKQSLRAHVKNGLAERFAMARGQLDDEGSTETWTLNDVTWDLKA
jgi:serine/threonine protein kinase